MKLLDSQFMQAERVGVVGHVKPDGDCIGACLALYHYLHNRYPKLKVMVFLEEVPEVFQFLEGANQIFTEPPEDSGFDIFISVDCSDQSRHGKFFDLFEHAKLRVNIDHHISNLQFGDINEVRQDVSASCEVLYELFNPEGIDRKTAMALYLGIVHDTGMFRYSNTSRRTLEIAGDLISYGFPFYDLIDKTFYQKTWVQNRLMGCVVANSSCYLDGQLIISYADGKLFEELQAGLSDTEGIIEHLRTTKGVRVAVAFFETKDHQFKVSLRATDDTDVSAIALKYGGGGHKKAAGFTSGLKPQALIETLTNEFSGLWNASL